MKKFKYPLAITGPVEELKALVPELERLGWSWGKQKWWNRVINLYFYKTVKWLDQCLQNIDKRVRLPLPSQGVLCSP